MVALASSGLSDAGNIASIAAAAFAGALLAGGVARWAWSKLAARDIDHGLHVVGSLQLADVRIDQQRGLLSCRVGLDFRNGSTRPLTYMPHRFSVRVADTQHPLIGEVDAQDIAPGETKGWFRHPTTVELANLPATVGLDFEVAYGRLGGPFRRQLVGVWTTFLELPEPAGSPGTVSAWTLFAESAPIRDQRIPGSIAATRWWRRVLDREERRRAA